MNDENSKYLCQKYRYMFNNKDTYYFACDDGWFNLLDAVFAKIKKADKDQSFRVTQLKEKFGTLRLYYLPHNEKISDIITKAENASSKICEICGKDGGLCVRSLWYKTLCKMCCKREGYKKYRPPKE